MANSFGALELQEIAVVLTFAVVASAIVIWPVSRILRRLGFSAWLAPLAVIPLVNIGLLYFVAFAPEPEGRISGGT